jgi:hypothetical protein
MRDPLLTKTIMTPLNLQGLTLLVDYRAFGDEFWQLATSFSEEAVKSNHEIFRHDLPHYRVKPCQKCQSCYSKEVACSFLDDFNVIPPDLLLSKSLVVFAEFPISATLENVLSKLVCLSKKEITIEKVYLIYQGETSLPFEENFKKAVEPLRAKGLLILRNPKKDEVSSLAAAL